MSEKFDLVVIGGGIVGTATALALINESGARRIILIEKENELASHQTGRNSGVIHAGVYYAPGSRKARLCRSGLKATKAFCVEHGLPFAEPGKLIVAAHESELERMRQLAARARQNGVAIETLSAAELTREEPNVSGAGALLAPETGIVNYRAVTRKMAELFRRAGGEIRCGVSVEQLREHRHGVTVATRAGAIEAAFVVSCAGLWSDQLLRRAGIRPDFRIIPFRGSYFALDRRLDKLVHRMIYPVPDPARPFLGVHITPMLEGFLTLGPNASVALSREGCQWRDITLRELLSTMLFPGFWRMLGQNAGSAISELRSTLSRRHYLRAAQKYCPAIALTDLRPHPAGLRAQAVLGNGALVDDFLFHNTPRTLHVCNAPSPAATAALPIAQVIVAELAARLV